MTDSLLLSDAQRVIGRRWSKGPHPGQVRTLLLARDALDFIFVTGQWYPFLDFREGRAPRDAHAPSEEGTRESRALMRAMDFFEKLLGAPEVDGDEVPIQLIIDVLRFISTTGQIDALGDFIEQVEANEPPLVIASFDTQAEAQAWLSNHPNPPNCANVLIGGRYHDVVYERETDFRRLPWNRSLEYYLSCLQEEEPPVATASFATLQEAEAWLANQPRPPRRAWVTIAGEFYLAVFHPYIHHRALYPLSLATRDAAGTRGPDSGAGER